MDRDDYVCWCELHGGPGDGYLVGQSPVVGYLDECTNYAGLLEAAISDADPHFRLSFPHRYELARDSEGRVRVNSAGRIMYVYAGDDRDSDHDKLPRFYQKDGQS